MPRRASRRPHFPRCSTQCPRAPCEGRVRVPGARPQREEGVSGPLRITEHRAQRSSSIRSGCSPCRADASLERRRSPRTRTPPRQGFSFASTPRSPRTRGAKGVLCDPVGPSRNGENNPRLPRRTRQWEKIRRTLRSVLRGERHPRCRIGRSEEHRWQR